MAASVSGGCVEGAAHEVAGEVLATGTPQPRSYGIGDDEAFGVGLTCGGTIDVPVASSAAATADRASLRDVAETVARGEPGAVATLLRDAVR